MSVTSRLTGLQQALRERLSQLDTKLLCFRSPQHLSRHLLDATTLLLLDRGSVYYCTGKKRVGGCTAGQGAAAAHDSSALVS